MPISWNEIRHRAIAFSKDWHDASREEADAKSFWDGFFNVFGISRRAVASFEEPVKNLSGEYGYIDLFWKGVLLVEHKSRGKNLDKASSQAFQYIQNLVNDSRHADLPRYVIVSDFARLVLYDLDSDASAKNKGNTPTLEFPLADFHKHIQEFAFIPGYKIHKFEEQNPLDLRAVEILGKLHDTLEDGGYKGHELERFLVRILFCLFAEDTSIFDREIFRLYIEERTAPDGSDLGLRLARLFDVLNTPAETRQANLDDSLKEFPYVNGGLFAERLSFADFNSDMRNALLACTRFDWSAISPAVFGSLFQAVMEPKERRQIGAHYTSERDILKVIRSLFLDDLRAEFAKAKKSRTELERFHEKLARLRFFDPACGCGNFLILAYRELRLLETEVLLALYDDKQQVLDITQLSLLDVDAFYGIELREWPVRIAEVAMWLMDHQMNLRLSEAFGKYYKRLPLRRSPTIVCGNALRLDWKQIIPPEQCSYMLGNPPFVGAKLQSDEQRGDMELAAGNVRNSGLLDYVCGWYFKAAEYMRGTNIVAGFVSTNSITQGEQAGVLWNTLFHAYGVKIHFAHRTFPWESEARGKAHVHVVIIGFGTFDASRKLIYEYDSETGNANAQTVKNIGPYLTEGPDKAINNRSKPLSPVPEIGIGNKPIDNGNYLFTPKEKKDFLKLEPNAEIYFKKWLGSDEFINNIERWCLWLGDCSPEKLRSIPHAMRRVEAVKQFRLESKSAPTQKLALTPTRFHVENMPDTTYLLIPKVSSEKRNYIPMGFISAEILTGDSALLVANATQYHFGVLSSAMHMAWVRQICGRLESRYRYSGKLVYNNFPWPEKPAEKQTKEVEEAAQAVLEARAQSPNATLADLYDPLSMPKALVKAHEHLDRSVDKCYRAQPFTSERQRIEFLFDLYERLSAPLASQPKKRKKS